MTPKAPAGTRVRPSTYETFRGIDTSRHLTGMDTGSNQHFTALNNAYCDWRGQIVRDPPARHVHGDMPVVHCRHFTSEGLLAIHRSEAALNLVSTADHRLDGAYPPNATPTSTVFNRAVVVCAAGLPTYRYDGAIYTRNQSEALDQIRPAFCATAQRRLCVAGGAGSPTMVHISRVDNDEVFPDDEPANSENVLRAGRIDIRNLLGNAEKITGLTPFETSRLLVFTSDRAILYRLDPDIEKWNIDDNANIQIGCASHNSIVSAGTDILFCSRSGIHSIQRSRDNGILVFSVPLSEKVNELYRRLYAGVPDPQMISGVWDQDMAQYHVFFPYACNHTAHRLTLSMNPEADRPTYAFSTGTFLSARCGASLGGSLVFGTPGGLHRVLRDHEAIKDRDAAPQFEAMTPMLWHGSITDQKETRQLIIQASGPGVIEIDGWDDRGRHLGAITFEVDGDPDDNAHMGVPLSRQYERPWRHVYRGARYRIRSRSGSGTLRVNGFAVVVAR